MSTGGSGTPINKPLGHLDSTYFPSATSSHMSRTVFLNGTYKTYFGSGQSPDGMTGSINRGGYQKPVDWNKANTLLRAPQQVWLAADIAINLNVQISSFIHGSRPPGSPRSAERIFCVGRRHEQHENQRPEYRHYNPGRA